MNSLMTTLQQPMSVAVLAQCLGFGARPARRSTKHRGRSLCKGHRSTRATATVGLPAPGMDDDAAAGCGWYDSSHELHQGLVVLEHSGAEGLATELPVTVWLKLALDSAPACASAARV